MSGFVFHPEAYADLEEIWHYITADDPSAADRFLTELEETIRSLVRFPAQGHARPDLTSRPLAVCGIHLACSRLPHSAPMAFGLACEPSNYPLVSVARTR
jgi:plasmid stabilization system protein ParE